MTTSNPRLTTLSRFRKAVGYSRGARRTPQPRTGALQDRCLRAMQSATRERRESRSCRGDMLISIGKCKWQGYKYKTRGHALYGDGKMRWPEQVDRVGGQVFLLFRGPLLTLRRAMFLPIEGWGGQSRVVATSRARAG